MNYLGNNCIKDLNELFEEFEFEFDSIKFGGEIPIFLIHSRNEESLNNKWQGISDFIAGNFQARLTDEYQVWNIYLFYILKNSISKDLKYRIENDTFSSRKIVIDFNIDKESMISDHIINNLIIPAEEEKLIDYDFEPNILISSLLSGRVLKKINITREAEKSFKELVQIIKEQENEI